MHNIKMDKLKFTNFQNPNINEDHKTQNFNIFRSQKNTDNKQTNDQLEKNTQLAPNRERYSSPFPHFGDMRAVGCSPIKPNDNIKPFGNRLSANMHLDVENQKLGKTTREFSEKHYDITVKPKIDKYNQAQQILESHREKTNRINLNFDSQNLITLSPNISYKHKSMIKDFNILKCHENNNEDKIINDHSSEEKENKHKKTLSSHIFISSDLRIDNDQENTNNKFTNNTDNYEKNLNNYYNEPFASKDVKTISKLSLLQNPIIINDELNRNNIPNPQIKIIEKLFNKEDSILIETEEMKNFLFNPLDQDTWLKCKIERNIIDKKIIKYIMYLSDNDKFLLTSIKKPKKAYTYHLTIDPIMSKDKKLLGKLKSNFFGTEFNFYDSGKNPKNEKNKAFLRRNLAVMTYETNILGLKGPRKMKVYIPKVNDNNYKAAIFIPTENSDNIKKRFLNNQKNNIDEDNISVYINKQPEWSKVHTCYVLDYKDRSIKQSVKNFQLVECSPSNDQSKNDDIVLQFGRTSETSYILDFKFPFSPLQALSIALSSIDNKLACE